MTDRERLLEVLREEERASFREWKWLGRDAPQFTLREFEDSAYGEARQSAHHALTVMAIREVIEAQVWLAVSLSHDGIDEVLRVYLAKDKAESELETSRDCNGVEGPFDLL